MKVPCQALTRYAFDFMRKLDMSERKTLISFSHCSKPSFRLSDHAERMPRVKS
jgi:hypothetical protein